MNIPSRTLSIGVSGADVRDTQLALTQLGFNIAASDQQTTTFGQPTHDAVIAFQTAHGLQATGVIDTATATALSTAVAEATYTVTGTVSSPGSASVGGLTVTLADKNVGGDVTIGTTTTDAKGRYSASVVIAIPVLTQRHKTAPDVQARISAGKTFLAASEVAYNAASTVILDVDLPATAPLPSEYETLTASLTVSYGGSLTALQENADRQDITYLANKTGWDARAVALASLAAQFGQPTPSPAGTTSPAGTANPPVIRPEFYYALFRAGLPANADTLYQANVKTVEGLWNQAIAQGVIPSSLAAQIPAALSSYQTLSAAAALTAKPAIGLSPIKDLLQVSMPNAQQQTQFAQLYTQYAGDTAGLWQAVEKDLGAPLAASLKLDGQLGYMTINNAPLMTALHAAEKATPLTSSLDLVARGYHDAAKWKPLIGTSIPAQIPGATADEQQANYAGILAAQVRIAFPTLVIADLIRQAKIPVQGDATIATGVTNFLTTNQGKFEIGLEPVEGYIARSNITGTPTAVVTQLKRLQRVYQLTPNDQSMAALLQANIDSAFAVTRYDATGFAQSFGTALGGAEIASDIHARAQQIHGSVLGIVTHYLSAQRAPVLGAAATPILDTRSVPRAATNYPVAAYPTLQTLLGSMDYCQCDDCRSILSPAAYLVDLLHFTDSPTPQSGFENPQDVLLGRRPDLQQLELTCANTNTALPYIDIVNETLEYFVANNCSLTGFAGFNTEDGVSSAELLATPQNVNDAAYTILQAALFPAPLPFHRPLTMLRGQLQAIGVTLYDAMTALRANEAIERGTQSYAWRDILMERLGLSREEYRLLTDSSVGLHGLYGYAALTDDATLALLQNQNLQDFSRRLSVSYDDLFAILQTTFINPNSALIPLLQQLHMPFSTLQKLQNGTMSQADFDALLPAGIDARAYGATAKVDPDAIATWVKNNYARIMSIIAYANPTDPSDLCSSTELVLRYTNPDTSANLLYGADFAKLIRFIRLRRKLGLGVGQVDDLIAALYPAADLPTGASDTADEQLLDAGFLALLPRIGFLYKVMDLLGIGTDQLPSLLACWAPIDTTGTDSLYASMFLSPSFLLQDQVFATDSAGHYLQDATQKLVAHESGLCAAFHITGQEFDQIVAGLNFDPSTALTLENISAIHRIGWLARVLRLSVTEFLALRKYTGLDPFASLDPVSTGPAEPAAIHFIRLVNALNDAGVEAVQALYLFWNQDLNGKATPPDTAVAGLATMLRSVYAAVESQFNLVDDPDGSIAKAQMGLVYGAEATDFFFGLLNNTLVTTVPYSIASGVVAQPVLDASTGRLSYDDLRKQLAFAGVLDATTQTAIDAAITANGNDATLHVALAGLAAANHQAVDPFFAAYPELVPLYAGYVASTEPLQGKRTDLLAGFLPSLKRKRKEEQALASISAVAAIDSGYASALLQDPSILHAAARSDLAAISDLTSMETTGLSAAFYLTDNTAVPADELVDAVASINYAATGVALPAGQGGGAITGVWSGFLNAPQDGFYDLSIASDAGAVIEVKIAGVVVPLASAGNAWTNQTAISLTAGELTPITLSVAHVKAEVILSWRSQGLGWQVISGDSLYAASLVDRLRITYLRFLKTTALAAALALTPDEIAYLGTATGQRVNTTDAHDKFAPGNNVFTPASMLNIQPGATLTIDTGAAQETVTVTTTTPATFSAITTKSHDGTVQPFAIIGQALPAIGKGWLNFLPTAGNPDAATAAALRDILIAILDYRHVKTALGTEGDALLSIIQAPNATNPDGTPVLLALTGWSLPSVQALLQRFFGDTQLTHFADISSLRRIFDASAIVAACRVPAATLISAATNAPGAADVAALQSALRALYATSDWRAVARPINDALRQAQRDALVAYILQQLGDLPPGSPPSSSDLRNINTADKLYEYFLIDPQTEPAVQTSRIRLALSATQIFIERCQRNLEAKVSPADIAADEWTWMKRYRVWQANRELFLWPENWLYPELRDDQSPFFEQMMSSLLQSDITDDAAAAAYLDYLSDLESVAKLEPCGLYYVSGEAGKANETAYVVGRTAGAHRKYYFRQLANASWSPWTEMKIDPDDLPVTPIVWNGRLLVFWLKVMKKTPVSASSLPTSSGNQAVASMTIGQIQDAASSNVGARTQVTMSATLCWSEFYNGKWQATKTSDLNRPTFVGTFPADDTSFEANRSLLRLDPTELSGDMSGALLMSITSPLGNARGGFVLYNTHSLPIRIEEISPTWPLASIFAAHRTFAPVFPYTGGSMALAPIPYIYNNIDYSTFTIDYSSRLWISRLPHQTNKVLKPVLIPRYVAPQGNVANVWDAPFFYEDRRNVFYVKTSEAMVNVWQFTGFGLGTNLANAGDATLSIPPLVRPPRPTRPDPVSPVNFGSMASGGDPLAMQQFVAVDPTIQSALGTIQTVTFQGQEIGAKGRVDAEPSVPANRSA